MLGSPQCKASMHQMNEHVKSKRQNDDDVTKCSEQIELRESQILLMTHSSIKFY